MLFQRPNGVEQVITYASRTLNNAEKNYSVFKQKCVAIVWGIQKMKAYLEDYHFVIRTGVSLVIQKFDFEIEYRKGKLIVILDALYREPVENTNSDFYLV